MANIEQLIVESNPSLYHPELVCAFITPVTLEARLYVQRFLFDGYLEYHICTMYKNDIYTRKEHLKKEVLDCLSIIRLDMLTMIDDYIIKFQPSEPSMYRSMLGITKRVVAPLNLDVIEIGSVLSLDGINKPAFILNKKL